MPTAQLKEAEFCWKKKKNKEKKENIYSCSKRPLVL